MLTPIWLKSQIAAFTDIHFLSAASCFRCQKTIPYDEENDDDCDAPFGGYKQCQSRSLWLPEKVDEKIQLPVSEHVYAQECDGEEIEDDSNASFGA